jgi:hypothetical protein
MKNMSMNYSKLLLGAFSHFFTGYVEQKMSIKKK